ncbi:MAG: EAL domain-containing protein, partial [Shewanella vesiculosa]|uniref:EAL domain-containing protein n=6 Tax=Shewanellaceae TaxID=267890 RepID=UPI00235649F3
YSSFSYITQLPLSKLKIDQSFIRNMLTEPKLCNVTETMIAMAGPLSLSVIAEGVESHEHIQRLKDWGCDEVQGYHIAKPMPLESLNQWLISTTLN